MKQANGAGSVYKLSGNRRKPFVAMVTVRTEYDEIKDNYIMKRKALGYFKTQAEARKCLADYNAHQYDASMIGITFGEIWERVYPELEKTLGDSRLRSIRTFEKYVAPLNSMKMTDIRLNNLQSIIDNSGKNSSTNAGIKTIMNKVFDYAMKNDIVSKNYAEFVKYEKYETKIERTMFAPEYVKQLIDAPFDNMDAVTLVLLFTGMRVREFINNTSDNIDLDNRLITIPKELAKNKTSERIVPIHEAILPILRHFKEYGNKYIAMRTNTAKMSYSAYYDHLKKLNHTPHDTRHTFISKARECGIDALVIQKIVGHTPETITEQIYTHIKNEELIEEINKLYY